MDARNGFVFCRIACVTGASTMPSSSVDLNAGSRGGGRSVEFFDQINKASIVMLAERGLVPHPVAAAIARGIGQVIDGENASGAPRSADYLDFEPRLIAVVGQDASRLHIGRSRQDIGATIARMSLRDGVLREYEMLLAAREKLLAIAGRHQQTIIPAYTHGVQAQPTTLAHYLMAWESAIGRSCERLQQVYRRINMSPLGAAALATSSFPINRRRLAELLGFDGLVENSYDANHLASTDSSLEVAGALQIVAVQLGQFAQDLHAQYAAPSPWLMLSEGKLTGVSSLMPQKRNPAALEQLRTQSSLLAGDMQTVLLLSHNNRPGMFDHRSYDPVPCGRPLHVFQLFLQVLDGLVVDEARALAEVNADYSTTSGIADALLQAADVPFRTGHHFASDLTSYGRSQGLKLHEIPYAEAARLYRAEAGQAFPLDEAAFRQTISAEHMVSAARGVGGPQPAEVKRVLVEGQAKAKSDRGWLSSRKAGLAAAEASLDSTFAALVGMKTRSTS